MDETVVEKPPLLKPYDNWLVRTLNHKRGKWLYLILSLLMLSFQKKRSLLYSFSTKSLHKRM